MLEVKLAFEEGAQWLDGTEQPFVLWADHKNQAYIQSAKMLFSRFNFSLTSQVRKMLN